MEGSPLDPQELEAIREAIQDSSASHGLDDDDVAPLSIIADDLAAASARPEGRKIADRWARDLKRSLRHMVGAEPEIQVVSCDAVEGPSLREELFTMWTTVVSVKGRPGHALIGVGGSVIEALVARQLGATEDSEPSERGPTATALRLFGPVGRVIIHALARAWNHEQDCEVVTVDNEEKCLVSKRTLLEADLLICSTLTIRGATDGRIVCLARPETLVPPPAPVETVPASPRDIDSALGEVPIELRIDLGTTIMTGREIGQLRVGTVIPLGQFIDDPLPIECAGVVKAYGRAVVHRGVLAVQIADVSIRRRQAA